MKAFGKLAFGAAVMAVAGIGFSAPAAARTNVGISFGLGFPGYGRADPCDGYTPPWGYPPGYYCGYPTYYQPVYYDGSWYRGPIYYRNDGGEREFWIRGGWHRDHWRGERPRHIRWNNWEGHEWRGGDNWRRHERREYRQERRHERREWRHERRDHREGGDHD